jgi:DNA mismatch repair ATPase MutS
MQWFYETDAYLSIAKVSRKRGFTYAKTLPFEAGKNRIEIKNVYHPSIEKAVANSITLTHDRNVLFLTGANMAGKSTLMKSFSIAVYLAHMGFPVAAEEMTFSVQDGIYTSINVADNLNMGYSHFYAEVLRVKQVATQVAAGKNLVVVFDELFKGTNVKDAYDATVAVTEAYSEYRNCSYIVSTHIIEAGHTLRDKKSFQFVYVPTIMKDGVPTYPYRLKEGITDDRHGMIIIQNEKIIETI